MTYQKILVPFLKENAGIQALNAAIMLGGRFKAHLDVVYMRPAVSVAQLGSGYHPIAVSYALSAIEAIEERAKKQAIELQTKFDAFCQSRDIGFCEDVAHSEHKGVTAQWSDVDPRAAYDFASRGRVSDLAVLSKPEKGSAPDEMELIERLVFHSGRPVLYRTAYGRTNFIS